MQATLPAAKRPASKNSGSFGVIFLALFSKSKALLLGMAKLKYLLSAATAIFSVFAYSFRFGWSAAIGFVALIFVHEMGHVLMLRHYGISATAPMFIPFVGAFISAKMTQMKSVVHEAYVALGGPLLGSLGAFACLAVYLITGEKLWAWLAYVGCFLNLFNMLPMSPFDGGRIVGAVWRGFWFVGVIGGVLLSMFLESPILLLFLVFGLDEINRRYMRVHRVCYYALGVFALIVSCMYHDVIWGVLIMIIAMAHGAKIKELNKALDLLAKRPRTLMMAGAKWCPLPETHKDLSALRQGRKITRWKIPQSGSHADQVYFSVPKRERLTIGALYIGLAGLLAGAVAWMHATGVFHRAHY